MKYSLTAFFVIFSFLAISSWARPPYRPPHHMGGERIVLRYQGEQFQGQSILTLKRKLKQQYPYMMLQDKRLVRAVLVAKTNFGRGMAKLVVGDFMTPPQQVGGNPQDFQSFGRFTFHRVSFFNESYGSRGRWQIHLRGNFKVKKVILILADNYDQGLVLQLFGRHYKGQQTIFLKRELKGRFPSMNLAQMDLDKVILVAKSKHGHGQASLRVGPQTSYEEIIGGHPYDFHSNDPYTFSTVMLENPNQWGGSQGPWQILLKGNIKVEKVIFKFRR